MKPSCASRSPGTRSLFIRVSTHGGKGPPPRPKEGWVPVNAGALALPECPSSVLGVSGLQTEAARAGATSRPADIAPGVTWDTPTHLALWEEGWGPQAGLGGSVDARSPRHLTEVRAAVRSYGRGGGRAHGAGGRAGFRQEARGPCCRHTRAPLIFFFC